MPWLIGVFWFAPARAADPSDRTFRAAPRLIGTAAFKLTSDSASRSGNSATCWVSNSLPDRFMVYAILLSELRYASGLPPPTPPVAYERASKTAQIRTGTFTAQPETLWRHR